MPERITLHWTAGRYTPNHVDKSHYHFLIAYDPASDTAIIRKQYPMDKTLSHTYRRYAGNVGISMCAMHNAGVSNYGTQPIKPIQVEAMCFVASQIALIKGIPVTKIVTHAEQAKKDGYFLDNADGRDIWGGLVNGDVRWDILLKPSTKSPGALVQVAKDDGSRLRSRITEYKQNFSDKKRAVAQLSKLGPIYRLQAEHISYRAADESFIELGDIISPRVLS